MGAVSTDDEPVFPLCDDVGKRAKDCDFFGAGRAQVFFEQSLTLGIQKWSGLCADVRRIFQGLGGRIDSTDKQIWDVACHNATQMSGRVGGG